MPPRELFISKFPTDQISACPQVKATLESGNSNEHRDLSLEHSPSDHHVEYQAQRR